MDFACIKCMASQKKICSHPGFILVALSHLHLLETRNITCFSCTVIHIHSTWFIILGYPSWNNSYDKQLLRYLFLNNKAQKTIDFLLISCNIYKCIALPILRRTGTNNHHRYQTEQGKQNRKIRRLSFLFGFCFCFIYLSPKEVNLVRKWFLDRH